MMIAEKTILAILCMAIVSLVLFAWGIWKGNDIAVEIACRIMAMMEKK